MAANIPRLLAVMAEQCTGRGAGGVVCAAAPGAARIGAAVLERGGNAYDAVVAMSLAEWVLLPPKCGLGGDLVAIASTPGGNPEALTAIGGAPAGLAAVAAAGEWREVGPNSVGPPAAAAGVLALAARGVQPLEDLAAPAVALAEGGFPWSAVCTDLARQSRELVAEFQPDGCVYYPDGEAIPVGRITRLPGLARAIGAFVADRDRFLDGEVGAAIVERVRRAGGVLTHEDLAFARAEWTPAVEATVAGRRLWATPAPTHGPVLLDALASADSGDSSGARYSAMRAAVAAHRLTLTDPSGTSMVSAADREGNAVVVIHSNSFPRFGSGLVVEDYDLILANRAGRGFTPEPGHANFPEAGRRPATTLHAWALADAAGQVRFLGGTPGGENQVAFNVQMIGDLIDGVDEPGLVVTRPRWELTMDGSGAVRLEAGFPTGDDVDGTDGLAGVAPEVKRAPRWGLRCAQQVLRLPAAPDEPFVGAADPRTVGLALGV